MSQRIFETLWRGNTIQVQAGWDRPLSYHYMVISGDSSLLTEADYSPEFPGLIKPYEEGLIYSNLTEPEQTRDPQYFLRLLDHLGISFPAVLEQDLIDDGILNAGNLVINYGAFTPKETFHE